MVLVLFVYERHSIEITRELKSDMELLLRKSDIKVFRNEEIGDQHPDRLQLLTTFGNTYNDLEKVNEKTKIQAQVFYQVLYMHCQRIALSKSFNLTLTNIPPTAFFANLTQSNCIRF